MTTYPNQLDSTMPVKPQAPQPPQDDPFAAMGGGVQVNGGWVPKSHPLAQQSSAPPPAQPTQPGAAAPGQGANVAAPTGPPQTVNDAFRQSLMSQLTAPVGQVNQAELQPQMNAYRTAQQRSQARAQNTLAETAAREGTNTSGGFLSDTLGLEQARGESEGAFEATLIAQQFQQQYARLQQAMQLAQQYGTAQDQLAVQQKLAELQAAIQREGLSVQSMLGSGDLALRGELGRGQLALSGRELDSRNRYNDLLLGRDYTQMQLQANRDAILAALGG